MHGNGSGTLNCFDFLIIWVYYLQKKIVKIFQGLCFFLEGKGHMTGGAGAGSWFRDKHSDSRSYLNLGWPGGAEGISKYQSAR